MTRRRVVVAPEFFERLDQSLPPERTAKGTPSATDFLLHDLTGSSRASPRTTRDAPWRSLRQGYRVLIVAGMTARFVAIYVRLASEDTVEIVSLDIDLD